MPGGSETKFRRVSSAPSSSVRTPTKPYNVFILLAHKCPRHTKQNAKGCCFLILSLSLSYRAYEIYHWLKLVSWKGRLDSPLFCKFIYVCLMIDRIVDPEI